MADDFTGTIKPCHESAKCPFCGQWMHSYETCEVVTAHAVQMLAHSACVDDAHKPDDGYDDDEEDED